MSGNRSSGASTCGRAAALVCAAVALATSGCGGPVVTSTRLSTAVGTSFSRLYVLQQRQLGHQVTAPDPTATCARTGSAALSGAGSWTCAVRFPYPDGHVEPLAIDLEVAPAGCYTASGPPAVLGQQRLQSAAGEPVTNPLLTFDGCLDPS